MVIIYFTRYKIHQIFRLLGCEALRKLSPSKLVHFTSTWCPTCNDTLTLGEWIFFPSIRSNAPRSIACNPVFSLLRYKNQISLKAAKKQLLISTAFPKDEIISYLAIPLCSAYQAVIFSSHISAVSWYCLRTYGGRKEADFLWRHEHMCCLSQALWMQQWVHSSVISPHWRQTISF